MRRPVIRIRLAVAALHMITNLQVHVLETHVTKWFPSVLWRPGVSDALRARVLRVTIVTQMQNLRPWNHTSLGWFIGSHKHK